MLKPVILIAEDIEADAYTLEKVLRRAGVENPLVKVVTGEEVLQYFQGTGAFQDRELFPLPSILFLDIRLKGADGLTVLSFLGTQPHLRRLLIVAVSAYCQVKDIQKIYTLGANTFLCKPIKTDDIAQLQITYPAYWTDNPL